MKKYGLQRTDTGKYYTSISGMDWTDNIGDAHSWKTLETIYELFDITPGLRVRNNYINFRTFMKGIPLQIVEFEVKSTRVQSIELWKSIK